MSATHQGLLVKRGKKPVQDISLGQQLGRGGGEGGGRAELAKPSLPAVAATHHSLPPNWALAQQPQRSLRVGG